MQPAVALTLALPTLLTPETEPTTKRVLTVQQGPELLTLTFSNISFTVISTNPDGTGKQKHATTVYHIIWAELSRFIRTTFDPEKLRLLQRKLSAELEFRSSHPGRCRDPHLRDATDMGLFRVLGEILDQVTLILSSARTSCREVGDAYRILTERLEPDERRRRAEYYYQDEDEIREREEEYAHEDELLASADPPTVDDRDEE